MTKSRFRVLSAEFAHETNTFSKIPTSYASFQAQDFFIDGAAAIKARGHSNTELAGFCDAARRHGWELVHVLSAIAQPAGVVTRDAFDRLTGPIVAAAHEQRDRLDGIALGLHGAMVTDFCDDGEGELLARLRAVVGPGMPIAVTLDLHANVTRAMCRHSDILVSYRTYPHIDMRSTAAQAGDLLHRTMAGEIHPVVLRAHLPMIDEANGGRTDIGAMLPRLQRARDYEKEDGVFAVSINAGFSRVDIAEVGPTVIVVAEGDLARHQAFAHALADDIWARRHEVMNRFMDVDEAAQICRDHDASAGPIVVADYADNPGGGGYGDATNLLAALLRAGISDACFGPIVDPQTVQQLRDVALGSTVTVQLGGKTDASQGGGPLALEATVLLHSDGHYYAQGPMTGGLNKTWGPTVVLRVQGFEILVVTQPAQMLDLAQFTAFGIDPRGKKVVGIKSMQHFRAAFEPIAAKVIVCDSGALCSPHPASKTYRRVPRPIFPLDQDIDLAHWRGVHADPLPT
ncbi:MAG TPA: M81 family metallopeptidase [Burkholderiaceae bacterium]|nr:M81 family metallopeptidase [Rhodoferax sp.]HQZ08251.1 M81 family metallopeptidase [Burkholderiaceae bacterium]